MPWRTTPQVESICQIPKMQISPIARSASAEVSYIFSGCPGCPLCHWSELSSWPCNAPMSPAFQCDSQSILKRLCFFEQHFHPVSAILKLILPFHFLSAGCISISVGVDGVPDNVSVPLAVEMMITCLGLFESFGKYSLHYHV